MFLTFLKSVEPQLKEEFIILLSSLCGDLCPGLVLRLLEAPAAPGWLLPSTAGLPLSVATYRQEQIWHLNKSGFTGFQISTNWGQIHELCINIKNVYICSNIYLHVRMFFLCMLGNRLWQTGDRYGWICWYARCFTHKKISKIKSKNCSRNVYVCHWPQGPKKVFPGEISVQCWTRHLIL